MAINLQNNFENISWCAINLPIKFDARPVDCEAIYLRPDNFTANQACMLL